MSLPALSAAPADGRRLFAASGEWNRPTAIAAWDVASGEQVGRYQHTGEVLCLAVSPGGRSLAAGGGDKAASLWQLSPAAVAPVK